MPYFSIIIPVYNRPDEVNDLLESLSKQTYKDFEVIIVEDGSTVCCADAVKRYARIVDIHYYYKENEGRSIARNYGLERAVGSYFIFFDSDFGRLFRGFKCSIESALYRLFRRARCCSRFVQ